MIFPELSIRTYDFSLFPPLSDQNTLRAPMEKPSNRDLTNQLAEDFDWLEQHCRKQGARDVQAGQLRLAAGLVRNCIGPFLDGQGAVPLHVAVVGGAGAGKSTVVNLLSGAGAAEANPQAGFTRHPIAYTSANGSLTWPSHLGFLGPLRRLTEDQSASLDEDVYQVRRLSPHSSSAELLKDFVIWDCPDMTIWAAMGYVPRLLEIAALADVIVYVASDERYNDEVPTQFLRALLQTGKPVVVCLMKMQEADAPAIVAHFRRDVLSRMTRDAVACLPVPHLSAEQLADPIRLAPRYRIPLLNQIAVLGHPPTAARQRVVRGAAQFLLANQEPLLGTVHNDVVALEEWRKLVQEGQADFDSRYRREYLSSERFRSFDEALVRLLELLELPGVGKVVSTSLWVVRTPYRLVKDWLNKTLSRPINAGMAERPVLEAALDGWLDLLRKEAVRRSDSHPVWKHIDDGFRNNLATTFHQRFEQTFRGFQTSLADEIERTARSIYEELEKSPATLNTLRGGNFALDVLAIGGALTIGHFGVQDIVLVPLLASIKQHIVELLGQQYVENQREQIRTRQQFLVSERVTTPLAQWLAQWPATGGSEFERLQIALRRIPPALERLDSVVAGALAETASVSSS